LQEAQDGIYSEAGLGKAYLKQMGVQPWQDVQPDMPPDLTGAIVSSYYDRIDPARDDFYRRLIDLRSETRRAMAAASGAERDSLDAEQMALKILANATSYGIFFEPNVEELADPATVQCCARHAAGFPVEIEQSETPGRYFHPVLHLFPSMV
jgi:hypothetical protein